jgi:hypothetical protein
MELLNRDNNLSLSDHKTSVKQAHFDSSLDSLGISDTKTHKMVSLYCANCGYYYKTSLKCADRTCVICRQKQYARLLLSYRQFLSSRSNLRLLTLTLSGRQNIIPRTRITRIRAHFKALFRQPYYRSHLLGGFYSIEAKKTDIGWNVHIHILYQGDFIAHSKLKSDWYKITGDSYIVDIRKVYGSLSAFKYILKYLTKSPNCASYEDTWRYNHIFRGVRLLSAFGTWYKTAKPINMALICPKCGSDKWVLLPYSPFFNGDYALFKADISPPELSGFGLEVSHDPSSF